MARMPSVIMAKTSRCDRMAPVAVPKAMPVARKSTRNPAIRAV